MTNTASGLSNPVLSPDQADVIRATLPAVGANIEAITSNFYQRLFTAHPELLRDLFNRSNQARGDQAKALAASIATYATVLVEDRLVDADNLLSRIANKHASLGVTRPQYQVVHDHLFAAIVEVLGDAVTPEVAAAWEQVYWSMADLLIQAEQLIYSAAGVEDGEVFRSAVVVDRVDHGPDAATFTVAAPDGEDELGPFRPGQFISVGAPMADGARQLRQYSLHGRPDPNRWCFTVKRAGGAGQPEGEVSAHLLDRVAVGGTIEVSIPAGDFVLDTSTDVPVVLLSAGVGVTPMLGLANHAAAVQPNRSVHVVHADRSPADQLLGDELAEAVGSLANGRLTLYYEQGLESAPNRDGVAVREGLIDAGALDITDDAVVYLCGPEPFLVAQLDALADRGIEDGRLHFELFTPNDWLLD